MWDKLAVAAIAFFVAPCIAQAQQSAPQQAQTATGAALPQDDVSARLLALEEKAQRADELEAKVVELEERLDTMESASMDKELEGMGKKLDIYGFFDSTLVSHFLTGEDNSLKYLMTENSSFTMLNLNLYFAANFTPKLRSLVELRFGFLPQGAKSYVNAQGIPEFERVDTTTRNRSTSEMTQYGSVGIERVQLTWQPFDQLGFTLGRFLTPFGIWNSDHGAPVVLPIFLPFLQQRWAMPLAQTGVMVHGKFLMKRLNLDYAVTVSNGRGPADAVYDIDQNKAVGLRLKLSYSQKDVNVVLGGYGFYGTSRNELESFQLLPKYHVDGTITEKYTEVIGAVDFLVEVHGLRFQAEGILKRRVYEIPPPHTVPVADATLPRTLEFQASHLQQDAYVLLAYGLPLSKWLGDVLVSPYVLAEHSVQDDSHPEYSIYDIRAGLNVRFTAFLVGKLEYMFFDAIDHSLITGPDHMIGAQAAVAF
ncbi:MAG: hypothetical protein MUC50_04045 [Myxococcota bacterium]|jgi:hypothetical protein|nr:hypothetical protein [Myxococcota bacterium]